MTVDPLSPGELATKQKQRNVILMNVKKELSKADAALAATPIIPTIVQICLVKLRDYQGRVLSFSGDIQTALTGDAQDKDILKIGETDDQILEMIARLEYASVDQRTIETLWEQS